MSKAKLSFKILLKSRKGRANNFHEMRHLKFQLAFRFVVLSFILLMLIDIHVKMNCAKEKAFAFLSRDEQIFLILSRKHLITDQQYPSTNNRLSFVCFCPLN